MLKQGAKRITHGGRFKNNEQESLFIARVTQIACVTDGFLKFSEQKSTESRRVETDKCKK